MLGGEGDGEPAVSLFNSGFSAAGIQASCEFQKIGPAELPEAIAHIRADRRVLGAAVTMPHTVAASRLLDGLGPEAQVIKAVNTISHRAGALIGWNTDRSGFAQALEDAGFQAKGRAVLVLGAGGKMGPTLARLARNAGKRVGTYNLARCRRITDQSDRMFGKLMGLENVWPELELLYAQLVKTRFE